MACSAGVDKIIATARARLANGEAIEAVEKDAYAAKERT